MDGGSGLGMWLGSRFALVLGFMVHNLFTFAILTLVSSNDPLLFDALH